MTVSIVIPVRNEAENIPELLTRLVAVLQARGEPSEIIMVDDHSSDWSVGLAKKWMRDYAVNQVCSAIKMAVFSLTGCRGKDYALAEGLRKASGDHIITMDGDLQNHPEDIPALLENMKDHAMVCGYRTNRKDSAIRCLISHFANLIRNTLTGISIRDAGCGLRIFDARYKNRLIAYTPLFLNNAHYFYPAIFDIYGLSVNEIPVNHSLRKSGVSKFPLIRGRVDNGIRACFVLNEIKRRRKKINAY